ncbi:MAG: hypothetical protein HDR88_12750 [Bacteroides sp.]|nr:hypothetical protein [Bacteroides sp.]
MKKLLSLPFIMLMMILGLDSLSMTATTPNTILSLWMYKIVIPEEPISEPEPDTGYKRTPTRHLMCTISQSEGIDFGGYTIEIISYEIREPESEYCMASFSTESDFINTLFSMPSGEYQLRLITDDYQLIGYLAL